MEYPIDPKVTQATVCFLFQCWILRDLFRYEDIPTRMIAVVGVVFLAAMFFS